jgi:hypothetical protein
MHREPRLGLARRTAPNFIACPSGVRRSRDVISPMIATAISGGDTRPIGRPIGA